MDRIPSAGQQVRSANNRPPVTRPPRWDRYVTLPRLRNGTDTGHNSHASSVSEKEEVLEEQRLKNDWNLTQDINLQIPGILQTQREEPKEIEASLCHNQTNYGKTL